MFHGARLGFLDISFPTSFYVKKMRRNMILWHINSLIRCHLKFCQRLVEVLKSSLYQIAESC